jgi:ribose transport system substrate-binding protein
MKRVRLVVLATVAAVALAMAACGDDDDDGGGGEATAPGGGDAPAALRELEGKVLSKGPNGEDPTAASEVKLTEKELAEIKGLSATAAIVMHYGGEDWSRAQIDGLKAQFGEMGIDVIATTDANFESHKQVSDIETVLARKPDIIVSIPTDPVVTADAYRKAVNQGVELVFMDNIPKGFEPGEDYVSVVSADNFGNGVASAHLMAEALGGEGQVGAVFHEADFFVTNQRFDAFKQTIKREYPDIEIVEEQGFGGPDFAGDGEKIASAMLTRNAELDGIWANWDVPAEGVIAGARTAGRDDIEITTIDLGLPVATEIASDGLVYGLGAQRPYDQGVTEAKLAGYALLDKEAPPYVALPALPVDSENVCKAWQEVYHDAPPSELSC